MKNFSYVHFLEIGLLLCLTLPHPAMAVDRDGLVGEWTFNDGTANDSSGNGNHGTGTANPVPGISGQALEFDGTKSIQVQSFSSNFVFQQGFTIEAWVYVNQGSQTMIRKGPNANFLMELGTGRTNDPGSTIQFGFATNQVNIGASIVTGPTLPLQKWTFVTMSYDGAKLRGYVNGELVAENDVTGIAINDTSQPLLFGNYSSEVFYGRLDEIRIWTKALPAEQIMADFEEFAPGLRDNLVGEWLFEGDGSDTSGNGNHGEPSGDATLVSGIRGQAFEFFGNGVVTVRQFSDNFVFTDEFSLVAWVYPTAGSQTMIRKGGSANFLLELGVGRTNDPGTTAQFGFATNQVNIGASIVTGSALPLNQWSMLSMTYDGQYLVGYINGVEVARNSVTGTALNDITQELMFGRYSSEVFHGILDEIRIWSRTLRPREIQNLFAELASQPNVSKFHLAERVVDDLTYTPGRGVPVAIQVIGQPGSVTVTETPPAGWSVSAVSHGGQAANGVITWNIPNFPGELSLTYTATPPATATGDANFAGTIGDNAITGFAKMVPGQPLGIFENHMDIGVLAVPSVATFENGVYTIQAAGREIWNHMEEFHFAYLRVSGDFSLRAKVEMYALDAEQVWMKAGLVARDDLATNGAYALIFVRPDFQISYAWRPKKGISPDRSAPYGGELIPLDLQDGEMEIERIGNTINLYYFEYGTNNRILFSSMAVEWQDPLYLGLAVSASLPSASDGVGQAEGIFSNVQFRGTASLWDWQVF